MPSERLEQLKDEMRERLEIKRRAQHEEIMELVSLLMDSEPFGVPLLTKEKFSESLIWILNR